MAVLFTMAFGACIGSLINVLVYRLPLGLDVVTPTSRCPSCETYLTWRENIPIFGWLMLRGRCRFCRSPISAEYPLVEGFVALLWAAVYLVLYVEGGRFLGIHFGAVRPEWAAAGFATTWPMFLVVLGLFSCLVAMTLVDARTCFIPMQLTTTPVVLALLIHPAAALWLQYRSGGLPRHLLPPGQLWSMPAPGPQSWWWIGAAIGGVAGVFLSNRLLKRGWIRRSFDGYEAWEKEQLAVQKAAAEAAAIPQVLPSGPHAPGVEAGIASAMPGHEASASQSALPPLAPNPASPSPSHPTDLWIQYPYARREMLKELVFLSPPISLACAGGALALRLVGPATPTPYGILQYTHDAPLWLSVLAGVFLGYLIGGGAVWFMRMLGTLGFGKEAMGLGDVHMMAAVGACLGWVDAVLALFGAAFIGVLWAALGWMFSGLFRRAMPFGPFLAMGTVLVWFAKPLVERLLSALAHAEVNLP